LDYLGVLQKIQNEGIQYPQRTLHFDSGLTYMRLYRLDLAANKPAEATDYLKSAQREFSSLGWKDDVVSPENLIKKAEMREASEAKLYNLEKNLNAPAAREGPWDCEEFSMRRVIALSIFALLGGIAGYFAAPVLSVWAAQSADPGMFALGILANYKSSVVCDCNDRPASEGVRELSEYLSSLQKHRVNSQKSKLLAQEIGLVYVRLSILEKKLDQQPRADEDLKRGQAELAALGWRDVSESHLTSLVTQLNSEYKRVDQTSKALAAPHR
jgi:hypothetical protein